ncbi:Uncharacterised protein [Mycolicibacterium flavescens]|nr:Uncharacterised protein [Mycolicibacterium flavescens]
MDKPDRCDLLEICILNSEYFCFRQYAPGGSR